MNELKYIIVRVLKDGEGMLELAVVFPSIFVHEDFAQATRDYLARTHAWTEVEFVAAGNYDVLYERCYGRSETMNLPSRYTEDEHIIRAGYVHV